MFGFLAQLLAWCFDLVPSYAGAIALFTLIIMAAVTPFTIKGMRSAAEMSRLQPEIKKLQDQYKNDRIKQNEEMQKLFKEHGVNPLGGCLPTLLPLPIFFVIFRLLENMRSRHNGTFAPLVRVLRHQIGGPSGYVSPHYLSYKASLTQHIIANNGAMKSFGVDLAATARQHHASVGQAIPYFALIVVMTASQYWQQRQINQRNPAAANANPQMKLTMQIFPAFYALISLNIPASVVLYLLLSGLYRMAQNGISYRLDPVMKAASETQPVLIDAKSTPSRPVPAAAVASGPSADAPPRRGFLASLREAADAERQKQQANDGGRGGSNGSSSRSAPPPPAAAPTASPPDAPAAEPPPPRPAPSGDSPLSIRPSGRATPPGSRNRKRRR
jgi:YidC/Oxa1 family membrane protein insertase